MRRLLLFSLPVLVCAVLVALGVFDPVVVVPRDVQQPFCAALHAHRGSFGQIGAAFDAAAAAFALALPDAPVPARAVGVYFDKPGSVPTEALRWWVGFELPLGSTATDALRAQNFFVRCVADPAAPVLRAFFPWRHSFSPVLGAFRAWRAIERALEGMELPAGQDGEDHPALEWYRTSEHIEYAVFLDARVPAELRSYEQQQ